MEPRHLPRWWPGTKRVEDARDDRWTQVFMTKRGRPVRADFHLLVSEPPWLRCWAQNVVGTPFERVRATGRKLDEALGGLARICTT